MREFNRNDKQDHSKGFLPGKGFVAFNLDTQSKLISKKNILLIEDDLEFAQLMAELMEDYVDLKVDIAADTFEAMNFMAEKVYDCVVLDWFLEETTGKKTMERVESLFRIDPVFPARWSTKTVPVIVMSAHSVDKIQPFYGTHFKYKTFISKRQSLKDILDQLREQVQNPYIDVIA